MFFTAIFLLDLLSARQPDNPDMKLHIVCRHDSAGLDFIKSFFEILQALIIC